MRAIKQFCKWMVTEERAFSSPVESLKPLNSKADLRRVRRALTREEVGRLLEVTASRPTESGMPGPERALLYRTALETGLRANELRTLRRINLELDGTPPLVRVEAAYSKHRKEDVVPLRADLAETLAAHVKGRLPDAQVFSMPYDHQAGMLRADLKVAEIPYKDERGRVVDFHALRHTFITNLARNGVHPKVAQTLARHSTIDLTMNHYTHLDLKDQAAALEGLPSLRITCGVVSS